MRLMGKAQPQRTISKRLITLEKVNSKNAKKNFGLTLVLQLLMMLKTKLIKNSTEIEKNN